MLPSASPLASKRKQAPTEPVQAPAQHAGENKDFTQRRRGLFQALQPLAPRRDASAAGVCFLAQMHRPPTPISTASLQGWEMTRLTYGGLGILDSLQGSSKQLAGQSPSQGQPEMKVQRDGAGSLRTEAPGLQVEAHITIVRCSKVLCILLQVELQTVGVLVLMPSTL